MFLKVCGSGISDEGPRIPYIKRQGFMHALLIEKAETSKGNYDNLMKYENFWSRSEINYLVIYHSTRLCWCFRVQYLESFTTDFSLMKGMLTK
jgi:hypothetical protein